MSLLNEMRAVTTMNLANVPRRLGSSAVIVVGIAGVVGVLISVVAMISGFVGTVNHTGRPDRVVVLRNGSLSELNSSLSREEAATILNTPGIKRDEANKPIGSAESVASIELVKASDRTSGNLTMRGVSGNAAALRPEIRIVAGRMFRTGVREVIVGKLAGQHFRGLGLGEHIKFRNSDWVVVGSFASDGDSHESELLADADAVLSAYRRNAYQSVSVLLDNAQGAPGFIAALNGNPTLSVEAKTEPVYYAAQSSKLSSLLRFVVVTVGSIMALGAVLGALNTMYAAVSVRTREIATLRSLGFSSLSIMTSVLTESLLLALLGSAVGALFAWGVFNGHVVSTLGSNLAQVVFRLSVSPEIVFLGVMLACLVGLIGGLFPAVRAIRVPIAAALRAT